MGLALLIAWAILGAAGWWAMLRRTPHGLGGRAPEADWGPGETAAALLVAFFFGSSLLAPDPGPRTVTGEGIRQGMAVYGSIFLLLIGFLAARKLSPLRVFGLAPGNPIAVIGLGGVAFLATYPLVELLGQLAQWSGHTVSDGDPMVQFLRGPVAGWDKAAAIALAVVFAPLTEELVFRGLLYGVARKYFGSVAAMASTALLFAAIHQNLPAIPAYFALAVGFTLAYERTGSLWAPILMHMLFNATTVVIILFFPEWIPKG